VLLGACNRGVQRTMEVVAIPAATIPLEPGDAAWRNAPEYAAKLLLQDLVEPRLMKASTPEVLVRSLTTGSEIAFRLQWADPTVDDIPGPGRFIDSCAVQIPKVIDPNLPDPQMGQPGKPVQITFWRADWQASVNGRPDEIRSIYPNASIDHYPFQAKPLVPGSVEQKEMAKRYAPADAVGNRRAGPREAPVEDLAAEGPGTLAPTQETKSKGKGIHDAQGWTVVIIRPLPAGFGPKARTQVAFAVWEGSHDEAGARKMRTGWAPLAAKEAK
jgi:Ethylbenzene dehydrogenase